MTYPGMAYSAIAKLTWPAFCCFLTSTPELVPLADISWGRPEESAKQPLPGRLEWLADTGETEARGQGSRKHPFQGGEGRAVGEA